VATSPSTVKPPAFRSPILHRALAALLYRDFRVLWCGALISTIGTWMQKVAQSWLVVDLTKSTFYLGLDDFLGQLPILLFTIIGGVIADRHDRRRLLIGSQYAQMATAFRSPARVSGVHVGTSCALVRDRLRSLCGPRTPLIPSLVNKKDGRTHRANSIQFNLSSSVRCW
jgi:MFS family permease